MIEKKENKENNLFQEKYQILNPEQKEAVDSIEGPVVVVAGPGTGKTQILTLRIANILNKMGAEFAPNILALTFTEAGVRAMRKRLADFIGSDQAYEVNIHTFHSFCAEQIKKYPEYFQRFSFSSAISDIEKLDIVDEILEKNKYKILKTFASDFHHSFKILSAISELKSEAISPEKLEESFANLEERYIESKGDDARYKKKYGKYQAGDLKPKVLEDAKKELEKQKELLDIYQKYQEELEKRKLFDFDDMILRVVEEAEENKDFLERLQEQFLYLLLDEHQDTNGAQNHLVDLILSADVNEDRPNIFVVGDAKQAIYKFQGATIEEFEKIRKKYRDVKVINLKNNYRSSQNILDGAYSLISQDEELKAENKSFAKNPEKPKVLEFKDRKDELIYLAEEIKNKRKEGVDLNEIAIFFRNNNESVEIADILEKAEIPYKLFTKEDILKDRDIKKLILLLKVLNNPYNDELLAEALFINFLNISPLAAVKVLERLNIRQKGREIQNKSVYKIISSEKILEDLDLTDEEIKAFLDFAKLIAEAKEEEKNTDFLTFLNYFINQTGFLKYIISLENNILALSRFEKIFNEIRVQAENQDNYNLKDFLRYIDLIKTHNLKVEISGNEMIDGVNLMTVHKSKGLEFDYVYLTNFIHSKWNGSSRGGLNFLLPTDKAKSDLDDERRLFYVAMTRARKELEITYPLQKEGQKKENEVSVFLSEIENNLEHKEVPEKNLAEKMTFYFKEKKDFGQSIFDLDYIRELFLSQPLSVSALNNYKKSPILYFFRNLIRLPSVQTKPLILGNIIHDALELYFDEKGQREIEEVFNDSLKKFKVPEKYYDDIAEEGKNLLRRYLEANKNNLNFENLELEKKLSRSLELKDGHILRLYGVIDKIELGEGTLTVVDYKTGYNTKAKRKKSEKELKRQLVFYKMLLDQNREIPGVVEKGVLDFVEELREEKDLVPQIEFLTDADVLELEKEINDFAEDILSGEFLKREYKREEFLKDNPYSEQLFDLWESLRK